MDKQEIQQAIETAINGNWWPIGSIIFLVGVIVFLFIYILRIYQRNNDKRHDDNEKLLKEVAASNLKLDKIVAVHDERIKQIRN